MKEIKDGDILAWTRKWIQWNDINNDKVTWGSHDRLDMSVVKLERFALSIVKAFKEIKE